MKTMHEDEARCDLSGKVFVEQNQVKEHIQRIHSELRSPESKKIKTDQECQENREEEEIMEVDDELVSLSNKKDERVLLMQKRFDEEEENIKEMKRKNELRKVEEEKKRKVKSNSEKKKKKKKMNEDKIQADVSSNKKDIPIKYTEVMKVRYK